MKPFFLALVFVAEMISAPVKADIRIVITDTAQCTGTSCAKTTTIATADMARFYAWVQNAYPAPPCMPAPCTPTPYTLQQSLIAWWQGIIASTQANVLTYEKANAANNATSGITAIPAN